MILGDFQFSLRTMLPNSMTRTTEFNWSDTDRIGDLPNLQNLGMAKDQIEIEGVFYPKLNIKASNSVEKLLNNIIGNEQAFESNKMFAGNYANIDDIRSSDLCKIANNLINDSGEILGKFVIASIKETQSYFDKNGDPQKIEFTLVLKKSPSTTNSLAILSNDSSSSFVDTLTNLARSYLRW